MTILKWDIEDELVKELQRRLRDVVRGHVAAACDLEEGDCVVRLVRAKLHPIDLP